MIRWARRRVAHALDRRFIALHRRVEELAARVEDVARASAERDQALGAAVAELTPSPGEEVLDTLRTISSRLDDDVLPALRIMAGRDAENRRLLDWARVETDYELAFSEPEPLVTVAVATFGRREALLSRSLPSVLSQTHERLEVLVIGDQAEPEVEAAVRKLRDPRVEYASVSKRYVYPDSERHWLTAATLTRNEGYRRARGRWLFDVDDDDAVPADAIATLLAAARSERFEVVRGIIRQHEPDRAAHTLPADAAEFSLSGALVHAHLRFFQREHVASALRVPGDVFRSARMLRAGVRFGEIDRVTYEYYPAKLWSVAT